MNDTLYDILRKYDAFKAVESSLMEKITSIVKQDSRDVFRDAVKDLILNRTAMTSSISLSDMRHRLASEGRWGDQRMVTSEMYEVPQTLINSTFECWAEEGQNFYVETFMKICIELQHPEFFMDGINMDGMTYIIEQSPPETTALIAKFVSSNNLDVKYTGKTIRHLLLFGNIETFELMLPMIEASMSPEDFANAIFEQTEDICESLVLAGKNETIPFSIKFAASFSKEPCRHLGVRNGLLQSFAKNQKELSFFMAEKLIEEGTLQESAERTPVIFGAAYHGDEKTLEFLTETYKNTDPKLIAINAFAGGHPDIAKKQFPLMSFEIFDRSLIVAARDPNISAQFPPETFVGLRMLLQSEKMKKDLADVPKKSQRNGL